MEANNLLDVFVVERELANLLLVMPIFGFLSVIRFLNVDIMWFFINKKFRLMETGFHTSSEKTTNFVKELFGSIVVGLRTTDIIIV
jgi:hypothetical protein